MWSAGVMWKGGNGKKVPGSEGRKEGRKEGRGRRCLK